MGFVPEGYHPHYYRDRFFLTEDIPEIFKIGMAQVDARFPKPLDTIRTPIKVPMPTIESNPNVLGPIKVTRKWYVEEKQKLMMEKSQTKAEAEMTVIQLLAQRERVQSMLAKLDPSKKKDSKKIAALNCKLDVIDRNLAGYRAQYGIDIENLDHGSRVGRWMGRVKKKIKKIVKKVKRFCKNYKEEIIAGLTALGSFIFAVFTHKLF